MNKLNFYIFLYFKDQLKEIRKMTLARIVCNNSNNVTMMQKKAFLRLSPANDLQLCNTEIIPTTFISRWSELLTVDPKSSRIKY